MTVPTPPIELLSSGKIVGIADPAKYLPQTECVQLLGMFISPILALLWGR